MAKPSQDLTLTVKYSLRVVRFFVPAGTVLMVTYCQHQKCWLIDAGQSSETTFVGGINPTFKAFEPGHMGEGQRHDVYVEVTGPSATDVHHSFVQRWNEASERIEE